MTQRLIHLSACALLVACGGGGGADESTTAVEETREPVVVETGSVEAALAGAHRSEANRARDQYRHPRQTLEFFGLEPSMNVIEMAPGAGWYTEVLAPVLRDHGTLTVAIADPEESEYSQRFLAHIGEHPEVYDQVQQVIFGPPEQPSLGPDGSADMVVTFRSTHNWIRRDRAQAVYEAMFRVLRPGGILGVVQHRADDDADPSESAETGYVPEPYVIELATNAGFVLEDSSDLNRNPNDDHDHPQGVWTLPPSLRLGDTDREQWLAIGESDRMTLRFRKPAEGEAAEGEGDAGQEESSGGVEEALIE